jgi:hypothetical protein
MTLELKDIVSKLSDAKNSKSTHEREWDLNQRFLQGQQQITYDRNLQSYTQRRGSSNVPTINQLLPIYRTVTSKLSASYPGIVVLPSSPSKDDIIKAQASEAALRYYWKQQKVEVIINKIVEYLLIFGNAGMLSYYDPDKDLICTKAVKPFDIFYDSGLADVEDALWVAIRCYYSKADLIEAYPDFKDKIEKYSSGNAGNSSQQNNYANSNYVPPDKVDIYEVYMKDGRFGFLLDDTYLFEGEMPENIFPFQHVKYTDIPNRLWGMSMLSPLIDIQSYYNEARGQILMNVKTMANPKWLIPKNSGVAPNAITSAAGEKIYYSPAGGTPQQVPAAPIPAYVIDNIRQLQAEMMDVAGIHSTTLGKRATGILSGKAIETMTAQDVSALQITQNNIESACAEMAKVILVLMKEFYTEPKMYRMLDNGGRVIWHQIQGTNIVDDPEISIEAGSLFQDKAEDREARTIALFQAGLIDKELALKELTYRTGNGFMVEQLEGMAHARDMLEAVRLGAAIEIFATDDLESFKEVFGEFIRSRDFYELPAERQDYIRDILIAASTPIGSEGTQQAMDIKKNISVFPRSDINNLGNAQVAMMGMNSPIAAAQQTEAAVNTMAMGSTMKNIEAANARGTDVAANEAISETGGSVR